MMTAMRGTRLVCGLALVVAVAAVTGTSMAGVSSSAASKPVIDRNAVLQYGAITVPANWDPQREREGGERKTLWQVWDRLTMLAPGSKKLVGMIATSWTSNPDGTVWTFQIRKDAKFHNGTPVTAQDVAVSVGRAKNYPLSTMKASLAILDSVKAIGKYTVRFKLNTAANYFPYLMATGAGAVISAKALASGVDIATNPNDASSGPYIVKSFTPTHAAAVVRSPVKYWDPNAGQMKEIDFTAFGGNDTAALNAILTGQEDVINVLSDFQTVQAKIQGSKLVHSAFLTVGNVSLFLNAKLPPLNNKLVRQAISLAIDRKKLATGVMDNSAFYSQQGFLPSTPWYIKGWDPFPYNVAKAKQLLAKAGYPNGFDLNIIHPAGYAPAQNGALVLQDMLKAIGVNLKIQPLAPADFTPKNVSGTVQSAITASSPAAPPVYMYLKITSTNFNGIDPTEADKVQAAMNAAAVPQSDPAKYNLAQQNAIRAYLGQYTWIPLMFRRGQYVSQPYVLNVESQPWATISDTGQDPRYLAIVKH
jgi:peptide/nickel transport system substrate-binding protein